jgi:hypothetical protein
MVNLDFNAETVDPSFSFPALPAGKYLAAIVESEKKETKAGTGEYLELTLQVLEGEHKGRKLWSRLNLDNPNEKAVQIARAELSSICRAVNVMRPKDSQELHNIPIYISIIQEPGLNDELVNRIKKYESKNHGAIPQQNVGQTPPWKR